MSTQKKPISSNNPRQVVFPEPDSPERITRFLVFSLCMGRFFLKKTVKFLCCQSVPLTDHIATVRFYVAYFQREPFDLFFQSLDLFFQLRFSRYVVQ